MKKKIFYFSIAIIILLTVFFMSRAYKIIDNQAMGKSIGRKCTVILDAGHGGEDGGAVSKDGVLEKDINLSITQKLQRLLTTSGFEVKMIRNEDVSVYDDGINSIKEKKISDLKNRLGIANKKEDNILISIHQNKFPQSKYNGAQVFYSTNDPGSKELAENIRKSIIGFLQPDNKRNIKPASKDIYILYNCKNVAVMVECGFLSNGSELQKLKDDKYQSEMAFSIYCGFIEYWKR